MEPEISDSSRSVHSTGPRDYRERLDDAIPVTADTNDDELVGAEWDMDVPELPPFLSDTEEESCSEQSDAEEGSDSDEEIFVDENGALDIAREEIGEEGLAQLDARWGNASSISCMSQLLVLTSASRPYCFKRR